MKTLQALILCCLITLVGCGSGSSSNSGGNSGLLGVPLNSNPNATPTPLPMFAIPSIASTIPGGVLVITTRNANGAATYSFSANDSGASLTATGVYTAGPTGNTNDVIVVTDESGQSVSVPILVGPQVTIIPSAAVVGINSSTTLGATGGSGADYIFGELANASAGAVSNGVYQAGPNANKIDVVTVVDSADNVNFALFAVSPSVTVDVLGGTFNTVPGGTVQLVGSGGSGTYKFYLANNLSGGNVDENTGLYTAGPNGSVIDVVVMGDTSSPAFFTVGQINVAAGP